LIQRLVLAALQVWLVGTLVFSLLHILPGDPVLVILGSERTPDPEVLEAVRARLGLDKPLGEQYVNWLADLVQGDLGLSLSNDQPVWDRISARLPRTLELVIGAMLLASTIGVFLGVTAALNWNTPRDSLVNIISAVGMSVPVYVVGTLLVLLFAVQLRWLPNAGYVSAQEDFGEFLRRLTLPMITLSLAPMAIITRTTRSSLLEVRFSDYVRTAYAKGLRSQTVVIRHMLRNAFIPVVTIIGIQMGALLGGTVIVEFIFNWPGLSTLLITSIQRRDYPVVQGIVLVIATLFILINLLVDLLYSWLDPRIRHRA
jgi:peptide/nickel transport system permease protein